MKTFLQLCNERFLLGDETPYGVVQSKEILNGREILIVEFDNSLPWVTNEKIHFEQSWDNLVEV
tara:strand:- start:179 stop:370 length:192 start_codon:yes stop_codon:yes gene_type:complete